MENSSTESSDRFKTIIAVLIALVTFIGAVVAWRASVTASSAGDADFAGLLATLNAEETRTLNQATMYQNYRAYTIYLSHNELGNLLAADLETASDDEAPLVTQQKTAAWEQATVSQDFFPSRYLDRAGRYDTQRELSEAWAEAGQQKDLNPEPHFAESEQFWVKSNRLVGILIVLAISLLFYTLAEGSSHWFKYVLALGGTLCLLVGVAGAIVMELLI
ncbi:MAG: hypothetical protein HYR94_12210 [Chloroflexi bacterium]|nr:hypothetical protein [Chloroflexota bacterium]